MEFEYRKYRVEDREQVLMLLTSLFKASIEDTESYFSWKYEQTPYTSEPLAFVAVDNGKIISFRGYMLHPLGIHDYRFYAVALSDTITDIHYRRKGIFSKLTKYSIGELTKNPCYQVITDSSSGGPTLTGYLKLGWISLAERRHLYSLSLKGLFKGFGFRNNVEHKIILDKDTHILLTKNVNINDIVNLANKRSHSDHFFVRKDLEYMEWRLNNPSGNYLFTYYYKNSVLEAYIILKMGDRDFDIVDHESNEPDYLKKMLRYVHKKIAPFSITCWTTNINDYIYQHKSYFDFHALPLYKNRRYYRPPFLIRQTTINQTEEGWMIDGIDMRNNHNWDVVKLIADEI